MSFAACWFANVGRYVQSSASLPPACEGVMPKTAKMPSQTGNRLLDRLPEAEFKRLLPSLEAISLPQGHELCRQNSPMSHVYFPTTGMVSVVGATDEGKVVETDTVGNE